MSSFLIHDTTYVIDFDNFLRALLSYGSQLSVADSFPFVRFLVRCASFGFIFVMLMYHGVSTLPPPPPHYFLNRSILAARNVDVTETNNVVLNRTSSDRETYVSADTFVNETDSPSNNDTLHIPIEFLRSIT
jgi:hypothetical protein